MRSATAQTLTVESQQKTLGVGLEHLAAEPSEKDKQWDNNHVGKYYKYS